MFAPITAYGVSVNTAKDQSDEVEKALWAPEVIQEGGVWFPPGGYTFNGVSVPAGLTLIGEGAHIHSTTDGSEYAECFDVQHQRSSTTFRGFTFYGNYQSQRWKGGNPDDNAKTYWHLEHRCAIRIRPPKGGHANPRNQVIISDCEFRNFTGDGVYCQTGTELHLSNCRGWNCHRGAVTIGGGTRATINGLYCDGNQSWPTGIYFETHGKEPIDVQMSNVRLRGRFKLECTPGSRVICDNITLVTDGHRPTSQHFMLTGSGHSQFSNCYFESPHCRIHGAGSMCFSNCHFVSMGIPNGNVIDDCNGIMLRWKNEAGDYHGQRLRFHGCTFEGLDTPGAAFYSFARNIPERDCVLLVRDCDIRDYNTAFRCARGCNWDIQGCRIDVERAFQLGWKKKKDRYIALSLRDSTINCTELGTSAASSVPENEVYTR